MNANEIKEYFKEKRENFETVRHPFINNSVLVKVGNKFLYFQTNKGIVKVDMNKYFAQFCQS